MTEHALNTPNQLASELQVSDRHALLDRFAENPDDAATWETAYAWVRSEGDAADSESIASNIPAEELIALAETVRGTEPSKRYDLMTQEASNGRLWFDVIEGFSMGSIRKTLQDTVEQAVQEREAPFFRALDVATGTGKSLEVLENNAEHIIGVDRNAALLEVAKQRAGKDTDLVRADITRLPFENDSFDLITSLGIEGALDKPDQIAFYSEIARVLVPGGTYLTAFFNHPHLPSEEMEQITKTSKAMLADMICDTVSGGAAITDRLDDTETNELFTSLGLEKYYYLDDSDEKNQVIIQVIRKN